MEYVADLFEDEKIENLGLEEVEYDDDNHYWQVAIGFSRSWDCSRNAFAALASAGGLHRSVLMATVQLLVD